MDNPILPIISGIKLEMQTMNKALSKLSKSHVQVLSEEWITPDQVLFALNISKRTLEYLKHNKILAYSKINGLIFFKTIDLQMLLEKHYINPSSTDNNSTFKTKSHV